MIFIDFQNVLMIFKKKYDFQKFSMIVNDFQ